MSRTIRRATSVVAVSVALGWVAPASAQTAASVSQELAQMRAQMEAMARRIDELEGQLVQARS